MHARLTFSDIKHLFGDAQISDFELPLCPINHKPADSLKSCYYDPGGHLYLCNLHIFGKGLSHHPKKY